MTSSNWHARSFQAVCGTIAALTFVVAAPPGAAAAAVTDVPSGAAAYQWVNQQQVVMPSAAGTLQHWYWGPDTNGVHTDNWGGGSIAGKTVGFAYNNQWQLQEHVVARGTNNHLLHWWWISADGERVVHYADWGGEAYSDPVAVDWNDQQHILARAGDGGIFHWWFDGALHTEEWRGNPAPSVGTPAVMAWGSQLHVVARGPNDELFHWWKDPGAPAGFHDWGGETASDPTVFSWDDKQQFFAKGEDGQLFHWWYDPADNLVHTERWGGAPGTFVGAPFGYKFGNQMHVIARGPANTLYHWWQIKGESGVHFADWGGQIYSDPVAVVYQNDNPYMFQQHIFAQSATNTLYHIYWDNPAQGAVHQDWGGSVKYP